MPQVYELFDGSGPGAYWFYAAGPKLWVVADLDTGKAYHEKSVVRLDVRELSDAENATERRGGCLARVGQRCLMTRETAVRFLRDYPADFDPATVVSYEADGTESAGPRIMAALSAVAGAVRGIKKNHEE